jgi:chromosome segregation ATPase
MKKDIADNQIMLSSSNSTLKDEIARLQEQLAKETQGKVIAEENRKFLETKIKILSEEMEKLSTEKTQVAENYNAALKEKQELQDNIEELNRQKEYWDRKAKEAQKEDLGAVLSQKKVGLDRSIEQLETKLAEKQEELKNAADNDAEASLKEEVAIIERELNIQEATKLLLLETIGRLEEVKKGASGKVELAPIVVQPAGEKKGPAASAKERKITRIDQANKLAIVNLGTKDKVEVGKTLYALRDGKKIAELEVLIARDKLSACKIKTVDKGFSLKTGDNISATY